MASDFCPSSSLIMSPSVVMSEETDSLNEITQCVDMRDEDRDTDEEEEQEDDVGARCVTVSKSKGSLEESGDRYESLGTALEEEESPSRPPCPPRPPCPCVVGCAKASKDEMLNLKKDLFLNISAVSLIEYRNPVLQERRQLKMWFVF